MFSFRETAMPRCVRGMCHAWHENVSPPSGRVPAWPARWSYERHPEWQRLRHRAAPASGLGTPTGIPTHEGSCTGGL